MSEGIPIIAKIKFSSTLQLNLDFQKQQGEAKPIANQQDLFNNPLAKSDKIEIYQEKN